MVGSQGRSIRDYPGEGLEVGSPCLPAVWGLMGSNEKKHFSQSYEDKDALDSAVLIMPLVFFMSAADPRFTSTLDTILKT